MGEKLEYRNEVLQKFYTKVEELKQEFSPSEWVIISATFGLEGYGERTNREIAQLFNCNIEQIESAQKVLVKKLTSPNCKNIMKEFDS